MHAMEILCLRLPSMINNIQLIFTLILHLENPSSIWQAAQNIKMQDQDILTSIYEEYEPPMGPATGMTGHLHSVVRFSDEEADQRPATTQNLLIITTDETR